MSDTNDQLITPSITTPAPQPLPPPPPLPLASSAPKVIYVVDSSRASFGELWRDQRPTSVVSAWIAKIVRKRLVGSVNDPNVETLAPFEVPLATELPTDVHATMHTAIREMYVLGFNVVAAHEIDDLFNQSRTRVATMQRDDGGGAVGRVWHRVEGGGKTHFYVDFLTALADGSFVWSTSAKSVLDAPAQMHVTSQTGAAAETLWQLHQAAVQRRAMTGGAQPMPAAGREQVLALVEQHHAILRDFHLARKLFRPMRATDQQRAAEIQTHVNDATAAGMAYPQVWAELVRMQQRKTGFGAAAILLIVSLALFIGIGRTRWDWEMVVLIVGILAFHELGHFAAMKVFRYRNVRMFFIPLLGAAVSGVNYSAPGWKKVIVALMGPLPGILLGSIAIAAGFYFSNERVTKIGVFALILNGFNLLPVLPLDGGRVMHTLFFARHWVLDLIFRSAAGLLLIGGSLAMGDRVLIVLGIFMLIGMPITYKLARVAADLRRAGIRLATPDEQMIPPDVADQIIARVRKAFPVAMTNRTTAQHTLNVYETINTRPPGWLVTTAFTAVHVGAVLFVVVLAGWGLYAAQRGGVRLTFAPEVAGAPAPAAARGPKYSLDVDAIQVIAATTTTTTPAAGPTTAPSTIIATFPTSGDAKQAFDDARLQGTSVALFGQSVMLPVNDRASRVRWFDDLERRTSDVFVASPISGYSIGLDCDAPDATAAKAAAAEAREYFNVPNELNLIPPWSPAFDPARRDGWRRARRTFLKLHASDTNLFDNVEMRNFDARMNHLRRRGDVEELNKVVAERDAVYQRLRTAHRRALLDAAASPEIDVEFGRAYLKRMEEYERQIASGGDPGDEEDPAVTSAYTKLIESFARELAPRMGQIEMSADGKPVTGSDRYSARGGTARAARQQLLRFRFVSFIEPFDGAPAMTRWLASAHGCRAFRYQFNFGSDYLVDDDLSAGDGGNGGSGGGSDGAGASDGAGPGGAAGSE